MAAIEHRFLAKQIIGRCYAVDNTTMLGLSFCLNFLSDIAILANYVWYQSNREYLEKNQNGINRHDISCEINTPSGKFEHEDRAYANQFYGDNAIIQRTIYYHDPGIVFSRPPCNGQSPEDEQSILSETSRPQRLFSEPTLLTWLYPQVY